MKNLMVTDRRFQSPSACQKVYDSYVISNRILVNSVPQCAHPALQLMMVSEDDKRKRNTNEFRQPIGTMKSDDVTTFSVQFGKSDGYNSITTHYTIITTSGIGSTLTKLKVA